MRAMKMNQYILIFLLLLNRAEDFVGCFSLYRQPKTIIFNRFSACSDDERNPIRFNGTIRNMTNNKLVIDGNITVTEILSNPMEVNYTVQLT